MNQVTAATEHKLRPLSEEPSLSQDNPLRLFVSRGQTYAWNEVTRLAPGERRIINVSVDIDKGGHGQMLRLFVVPVGARLSILQTINVGEEASWQGLIAICGEGEVNIHRKISLRGLKAKASSLCAGVLSNQGRIELADESFCLNPTTQSQILTKLVVRDASRSTVRARTVVYKAAEEAEAFEGIHHLVLGDQTKVEAIPELEVSTDKVKCSHAATVSKPEAKETWYFESRGLDLSAGHGLLAQGFIESVLVDLPEEYQNHTRQLLFA